MAACVDLARAVGRELAETFGVPVYLYGEAAASPERRSLADVRKGEFEGLRAAVAAGERLPDFGPHEIGRAGATAVGARKPLVAFNTYLSGTDEQAAKDIAREIRESAGGLPAVRAIGFAVPERGCVTVSMNLVDFEVTGVRTAFDAVVEAAASRGHGGAGLRDRRVGAGGGAPAGDGGARATGRLLAGAADPGGTRRGRLSLPRAGDRDETERGDSMSTGDVAIGTWLGELGSGSPTPGGGAAAGVAAATGAALIAMVGHLTVGKEGFEDLDARMRSLVETAEAEREAFLALADEDAQAFESVMASFGLPKGTDEEKAARTMRIQEAYEGAAAVPLELAERSVGLMELAEDATAMGNPHAASDGLSAGLLLYAGGARGDGERPDQRRRPEG